jgi:PAS domain S-box-containing protein
MSSWILTDTGTEPEPAHDVEFAGRKCFFEHMFLNLLPLPVFCEDREGRYLDCNQAFCDFMGKKREEIVSKTVFEINASPVARSYFERDLSMIASRRSSEILERVMLRGDGEYRNVIIYKSLLTKLKEADGIVGALLDITDLKESQAREEFYREKLVTLASTFATSKEQERRLIAQEIHDSIGQNLALAKLKLKLLGTRLPEYEAEDLKNDLEEVIATLDESLQYTRVMSFELGIPVLYQLGLDAALQWLISEMKRRHGLAVRYHTRDLPSKMEDQISAFLFRSAQELLTNVVKHAGVGEAVLVVEKSGQNIVIRVEDKGKGFDAYALSWSDLSNKSYGLFSLETLVRSLGGSLDIRSEFNRGTQVILSMPFSAPFQKNTAGENKGLRNFE